MSSNHRISLPVLRLFIVAMLVVAGCGSDESSENSPSESSATNETGLTAAQIENGIGPVTEMSLGAVDEAMAANGKEIYTQKCTTCHKLEERYIGPALGDVTTRRSPAFVMNMMLNPEEMVQKHPVAKELLAEYIAPMANQSLTMEEARAILEYLHSVNQ